MHLSAARSQHRDPCRQREIPFVGRLTGDLTQNTRCRQGFRLRAGSIKQNVFQQIYHLPVFNNTDKGLTEDSLVEIEATSGKPS